jgi:hypothetical protein
MTPHLDTIPGMQAAFQMGRAEYLAQINRNRLSVLCGWPSQKKQVAVVNNLHLNGGGMKQLKKDAIALALRECNGNKTLAAAKLKVNRGTLYAVLVLVSATCSFAQRGTLTPVVQPTVSVFNLAPAPSPVKSMSLTWDNVAPSYRVQVGATRGVWTNSFTISTNRFELTNNLCYAVWSVENGMESLTPSLWPSNRIGELWLRGMGTNLSIGTNIQMLCSYTNQPPGNMQFWGVANITTGWE